MTITPIKHVVSGTKLNGCLLPLGLHLNNHLLTLKKGDKLKFIDGEIVELRTVVRISTTSPIANSISMLIYGVGIDVVWEKINENYGGRLRDENGLAFITYKIIENDN